MQMRRNINFDRFEPWSGAIDAWEVLREFDKLNTLEYELEELYPDGLDETDLNDLLWFEPEFIYSLVGVDYNEYTGEIEN